MGNPIIVNAMNFWIYMAMAWGLLVGLVHGQTFDSVKVRKKHAIGVGVNAQILLPLSEYSHQVHLEPIPPYYQKIYTSYSEYI
jgi:hypothetical protein